MSRVVLSLACGQYERTSSLFDGRAPVAGVELVPVSLHPSETFWRQIRHREFDAAEMSLSAFILAKSRGDDSLVGLPIFPSRVFRHSSFFVSDQSTLTDPRDLSGATIGMPEYHMTAALFARGLLKDEYGIKASDISWLQAGLTSPGRVERVTLDLPSNIDLRVETKRTLPQLLESKTISAFITPRAPDGRLPIRRLFPDARAVEQEYFSRTNIFPIMHLVTVKREIHERHPWVVQELAKAFTVAKQIAEAETRTDGAIRSILPWHRNELESVIEVMGDDFWPYGIEPNRVTLEAACRYSDEQGLSRRRVSVEELFAECFYDGEGRI